MLCYVIDDEIPLIESLVSYRWSQLQKKPVKCFLKEMSHSFFLIDDHNFKRKLLNFLKEIIKKIILKGL